ncbi:hypothetical protein L1049_014254 [Liquidambar formosana]|uniref:Uncharacterized protein n=1 Tax=Liquidambar formosana TaxID=63359 RepID=A0AAP0RRU6_LIQFO
MSVGLHTLIEDPSIPVGVFIQVHGCCIVLCSVHGGFHPCIPKYLDQGGSQDLEGFTICVVLAQRPRTPVEDEKPFMPGVESSQAIEWTKGVL